MIVAYNPLPEPMIITVTLNRDVLTSHLHSQRRLSDSVESLIDLQEDQMIFQLRLDAHGCDGVYLWQKTTEGLTL